MKGNCDAELVLQVMIDINSYNQALIITGDGDFYCLVKHLDINNKLLKVLALSTHNCSSLLRKVAGSKISFVSDLRKKLEYTKNLIRTEPYEGLFIVTTLLVLQISV